MKQLLAIAAALLSAASPSFGIGDKCGACGSAITLPPSQVTTNSATLNGWINSNGSTTTVWFQWGATTNYGNSVSIGDGCLCNFVASSITNLTSHQLYNYRVATSNSFGVAYGDNVSFVADIPSAPDAATLPASQVTTNSATLNGWVNPNGSTTTTWFQWGTTTNYGSIAIPPWDNTATVASVECSITNLTSYQLYNYRLVASNAFGIAFGSNLSFPAGIPQLAIDPHPSTDTVMVIRWPAAATNWVLESTTNLDGSVTWSPWPDPPNVVSNQNTVAIGDPYPLRQQFFRLHQQ